jgi:hypothetical protein
MNMGKTRSKAKPDYLHADRAISFLMEGRAKLPKGAPERRKLYPILSGLLRKLQAAQKRQNESECSPSDLKKLEEDGA